MSTSIHGPQESTQQDGGPPGPARAPSVPAPTAGRSPATAVPWPIRVAAEWAWRVALLAVVIYFTFRALSSLLLVALALVAAVLLTALLHPAVARLRRWGVRPSFATLIVFITGIAVLILTGWFIARQFVTSVGELGTGIQAGVGQVRVWLERGPLGLTAGQIEQAVTQLTDRAQSGALGGTALRTAATAAEFLTGALLALFLLFFFLYDGRGIWSWVVKLFSQSVERDVQAASERAWDTLTGFVRGTVLVAFVDGFFIGLALVVLQVPLAIPLGVLTFLGAFVPLIGATVTGVVAILIALVSNGVTTALIVLGVVLLVQQLEGNVLQPFILGRAVSLHPVAVVLVVTAGSLIAGIAGAVVSVPLAAVVNRVVNYFVTERAGREPAAAEPAG
ncbi:MAG: AI-2E family transporter [Actinomycetota bacterium]|nr:AI-2E family transporter [Actinomycetota bacterium]